MAEIGSESSNGLLQFDELSEYGRVLAVMTAFDIPLPGPLIFKLAGLGTLEQLDSKVQNQLVCLFMSKDILKLSKGEFILSEKARQKLEGTIEMSSVVSPLLSNMFSDFS
jgi:hypothetical protein